MTCSPVLTARGRSMSTRPGRLTARTNLSFSAQDVAGNVATSQAVAARVDNTAPERIDVAVTGESGWRNHSDVELSWTNRVETDRAPIVAAVYKLCPAAGGECRTGEQTGVAMSRLGLSVPSPGQWTASVWLRDAAGNQNSGASSVPVSFGYDPERPKLEFEPASPADPTLVAVRMSDAVSGDRGRRDRDQRERLR